MYLGRSGCGHTVVLCMDEIIAMIGIRYKNRGWSKSSYNKNPDHLHLKDGDLV